METLGLSTTSHKIKIAQVGINNYEHVRSHMLFHTVPSLKSSVKLLHSKHPSYDKSFKVRWKWSLAGNRQALETEASGMWVSDPSFLVAPAERVTGILSIKGTLSLCLEEKITLMEKLLHARNWLLYAIISLVPYFKKRRWTIYPKSEQKRRADLRKEHSDCTNCNILPAFHYTQAVSSQGQNPAMTQRPAYTG